MAIMQPFTGIRYNQSSVDLAKVVAPPYDVISPEQQNDLYETSPYNVVRLILGREADRYASAARHLGEWVDNNVLVRDERPALYLLAQTFETAGGAVTRKGFIGACELVELDKGVVLPHEKTLSKPKEDRLKLTQATRANLSQIFGLYADPDRVIDEVSSNVMRGEPIIDVTFEDVQNKMWRIDRPEDVAFIAGVMNDRQILIADGHHRYETALAYRDLCRQEHPDFSGSEPWNYVMMFCANMYDEGLVIYPTHRVIHSLPDFDGARLLERLQGHYTVDTLSTADELRKKLAAVERYAFGYAYAGSYHLVYLKGPELAPRLLPDDMPAEVAALDVALLHAHILGELLDISTEAQEQKRNIDYIKDFDAAIRTTGRGEMQAAFLMNPTPIEHVRKVAEAGYTMPQKSTYFYPKLVTGLVLYPHW